MKKYENPIMNVSLFDAENVMTNNSGIVEPQLTNKQVAEAELAKMGVSSENGNLTTIDITNY